MNRIINRWRVMIISEKYNVMKILIGEILIRLCHSVVE